ncbi:MAG: CDP-alcohol phosphatidyltransferase family protein [bacterium]|jgi:CDP-diacylglycerol--glycerol-3-phosphate 3-phosphatidyltransferase|nr:CDP-alcohol phosphatidyltransferase family protein [candidate division KSB1 bacterium]MDH7559596.1 CDP-alcohol phosphatidyltransferase family protein [bacterium]
MPYLFDPKESRVLTVPNVLTVLRFIFLVPIYLCLRQNAPRTDFIAAGLMVAAAASDFFDGILARHLRQTSNVGRILDPLADKVCAIFVLAMLVGLGRVSRWYLAAVVARDLLILAAGAYLILGKRFVSESNLVGKMTAASVVLVILASTLRLGMVATLLVCLSSLLLLASVVSYGLVFARLVRSVPSPEKVASARAIEGERL